MEETLFKMFSKLIKKGFVITFDCEGLDRNKFSVSILNRKSSKSTIYGFGSKLECASVKALSATLLNLLESNEDIYVE